MMPRGRELVVHEVDNIPTNWNIVEDRYSVWRDTE
jgi:hypothetical protein